MTRNGLLLLAIAVLAGGASGQLAVRGELVHPVAGPALEHGVVLVRDGKIEAVGPASEIAIPPDYVVLDARVVTPGLIDAHSVVGLAGYLNQPTDQDQLDGSGALQPELRALDSYNARETLVEYLRGLGITTLHTGHGPGAVISGQTMIVKTAGDTVEEAVVVPVAMLAATLGEGVTSERGGGRRGEPEVKGPGTRSKAVAMLRAELIKAREYLDKRANAEEGKQPDRDLALEVLGEVVQGKLPLLVTVQRAHDILAALRVAREFEVRLVLDGCAEAYLVLDEIREAGVPVLLHPTMTRPFRDSENASVETAAILRENDILFALQSGYESYVPKTRVVLWEAALAAANRLGWEAALRAITLDAATILGVAGRLGSLEPGKDADLVLFDGDPFEYTTHCVGVVIDGKIASETPR